MGFLHSPLRPSMKPKNQLGQISILAALMIGTTFFLLLAFVVNTGMVVHAKINLQNAADVAAYAGAATQARQMNHIGILNYELRRQYKKFLYRYAVFGSAGAMTNRPPGGPVQWGPRGTHNVPAVCIVYDPRDNYCQRELVPEISVAGYGGVLDSIGQAAQQIYERIEELRKANCTQLGLSNSIVLFLWLYNTEPEDSSVIRAIAGGNDSTNSTIVNTLKTVARGMGLIPKNMLLKKRIDSLVEFVNYPAQTNVDLTRYEALAAGGDFFARERTLQAFQSAHQTLGPQVFDETKTFLDELLPPAGQPLLDLETVYGEFDTYAVQLEMDEASNPKGCRHKYLHIPIKGKSLPLGVYKKKNDRNVYYAVRLRSQARVLFSPFGDLEMTAYSAAKPFGSRIGPQSISEESFVRGGSPGGSFLQSSLSTGNPLGKVPNLPVARGEGNSSPASGKGFDDVKVFTAFDSTGVDSSNGTITPESFASAQSAAMAPHQAERGLYLIPADIEGSQGNSFDEQKEYFRYFGSSARTTFYAPLKTREAQGQALDPRQEIDDVIQAIPIPPALGPSRELIRRGMASYFGKLRNSTPQGTDELETYHFAKVSNPLKTQNGQAVQIKGGDFLMNRAEDLRSSWGGVDLAPNRTNGRIGYSVKFISFKSLKNQGLFIDDTTETVLDLIQH